MNIRVVALCKNEEIIMPFFLQHYLPWVTDIVIFDGKSTDRSLKIAQNLGGNKIIVKHFNDDNGEYVDDTLFKNIRNTGWKEDAQNYDWIIVCDIDEFLYHKNLPEKLLEFKNSGVTLPIVTGYQMVGIEMPVPGRPLTEQITKGVPIPFYNKNIIFSPKNILDMNYEEGSHICHPVGKIVTSKECLLLLHYRMLSHEYTVNKSHIAYKRLSKRNIEKNWGKHNKVFAFEHTAEDHLNWFNSAVEVLN